MKIFLLLMMMTSALMFGQTAAGTLTGVVTDPTGAVMPEVPVVATHVDTGTKISGITTETGNFTLPQLPVGRYVITVTRPGFKTFRRENVTIAATQTLRLDVAMEVGSATESVTVTAESTLLQSDSGAQVHNINVKQISDLPVLPTTTFIRDPYALALTLPGAVSGGTGFSPRINGLSNSNNAYKIDGEPVTNSGDKGTITTRNNVSPDAIQEVAIQSSNFNAEFGGVSGALFNLIVKSGSNQYHGTMYDYIANDIFNADDPGSHARNRVRRNDYGFNVGGPVRIPKLYNGSDKTFFFFNWEQYRDYNTFSAAINPIPTVPTTAYRNGDFTGLFAVSGVSGNLKINGHDYKDPLGNVIPLGTIFDPNSTQQVACNPALTSDCVAGTQLTVRAPFAQNNIVPKNLIDPVSAAILSKYVPLPQGPNAANGILTGNYLNPFAANRITRSPAVKIDQNLGTRARLSFTYNDNHTESPIQTVAPGAFAEGFPEPISMNSGTFEASPTYRVNFDFNIKPTMLFHMGVGWQEFNFCACPVTTNYNAATDIGLTGGVPGQSSFPRMASTVVNSPQFGGLNTLGNAGPGRNLERYPSSSANLTWVRGNHTIKFGADARIGAQVNPVVANTQGAFNSFGGTTATALTGNGVTWQPALNGLTGFTGFSGAVGFPFANWLMGSVTSATLAVPVEYRKMKQQWGVYLQDTWRVRRNLTIDYGVRWDYGTYAKEDFGRVADFSLTTPNPAADGRLGAYIYEASCGCKFAQNYPYAVGPRFGIAYTLNSKTVFRGGAGIAYGATSFTGGGVINSVNTPTLPNGFDDFQLKNGIPARYQSTLATSNPSAGFAVGTVNNSLAGLIDPNAGRPDRTYQWNISLQRELTRNTVLEVAYVGNRNIWQPTGGFQDFNAVSVQQLQNYGFTIDGSAAGIADQKLLNAKLNALTPSQISTLAQRHIVLPYGSFPASGPFVSTVFQSLKNFPQFSNGIAPTAPQGKSWYDSAQVTLTKRFSHGLSATGAYTFSKNLAWTSSPDIFNPLLGKDVSGANPPQQLRISFQYQVPRYKGNMPVIGNKVVSYVLADWALSSALYYQTAAYLGRPPASSANAINLWLGRGPGAGSQLLKNADGTFMNPWSVDWTDKAGVHHTDPLDINCHCFDPNTTIVLNPAAWQTIPDAQWTADTSTYTFFRGQRKPSEAMNFARNFKIKERYTFQIRIEFQNIFNRVQLPSPLLGFNPTNVSGTYQKATNGNFINGFGTFGNLGNGGQLGTPRSGQLIARFTF